MYETGGKLKLSLYLSNRNVSNTKNQVGRPTCIDVLKLLKNKESQRLDCQLITQAIVILLHNLMIYY